MKLLFISIRITCRRFQFLFLKILRIKPTQKYIDHIVSKHVTKGVKNFKIIIRIIPVTRDIDPVPAHFEYELYAKTIQLKHDQTFI